MKQIFKRMGSLMLSICMVVSMLPSVAFAIDGGANSPTCVSSITVFAVLSENVATQTVEIGTAEEELNLPTELTATITTVSEIIAETSDKDTPTDGQEQGLDAVEQETKISANGSNTATDSEAQEAEPQEVEVSIPKVKTEESTTNISVSGWTSTPTYDGNTAGDYTFTPSLILPEGIFVAEGVKIPQIVVTVFKLDRNELKAERTALPLSVPSEQFNLASGETYYFDLSNEKDNIGTINVGYVDENPYLNDQSHPALPDATLHYVPFTYVGTINSYVLKGRSADGDTATTDSQTAANTTESSNPIGYTYDHSLFVADYNISHTISWADLNTASLIFGKTFDTNYKLRTLSVGSSKDNSIVSPVANEWDSILTKNNAWIQNWSNMASWGQDTTAQFSWLNARRDGLTAADWQDQPSTSTSRVIGWRPALEVLDPDQLGNDGLKAVTLNLNGGGFISERNNDGSVKTTVDIIKVVCTGDTFTAPSGTVFIPLPNREFATWMGSDGNTYDAGASVPQSVTNLTAQWDFPSEQFNLTTGETYYFDLSSEAGTITNGVSDKIGTINTAVPDTSLHYVPFTYAGIFIAYRADVPAADLSVPHSLFVSDYNVSHKISWYELSRADLIFGKTFDTNYQLRSLSAGHATANNPSNNKGGTPTDNEWDSILTKNKDWIQNWSNIYSWGQETTPGDISGFRAVRGGLSVAHWGSQNPNHSSTSVGWRPALEVLNTAQLGPDGLKVVSLNLNSGSFDTNGGVVDTINIVCAGSTFKAPGWTGLTRPSGNTGSGLRWNTQADGNGTSYAVGANVPNTVTTLYAIWEDTYTVSGTVTDGCTNTPLAGASVQLKNGSGNVGSAVTTDGSGTYTISDIATGNYTIEVSKDGYTTGTIESFEITNDNATGKNITLQIASASITITTQPQNVSAQQGGTATFTIAATNAVSYQWYTTADINGIPHSNGMIANTPDKVSGATTATLTLSNITDQMNGATLWCAVSGSSPSDSDLSNQVTLTVTPSTSDALTGTATISGTAKFGETLTASLEGGNNTGTLSYQWKRGATNISDSTSNVYTIVQEDIGTTITVEITSSMQTGTVTSNATVTVEKADGGAAPNAPTLISKTHNTIAVNTVSGQEYRKDGGTWQDSGTFAGLTAETSYNITTRIKETVTAKASIESTALTETTNATPITPPTKYTVTVNLNGGDGSPSGAGSYVVGETIIIKAGSHSGYSFNGWTVTSGNVRLANANSSTTTFPMPANAVTVTANWDRNISSGSSGSSSYTPPPKSEITGSVNTTTGTVTFKATEQNIGDLIVDNRGLSLTSSLLDIRFDVESLKSIENQIGSGMQVGAKRVANLSQANRALIGDRPVYDITLRGNNGKAITNFGYGSVSVSIPYKLKAGEQAENLVIYHIDQNGKANLVKNSSYNEQTQMMMFETNHFSIFGVGYKNPVKFTDTAGHWAEEDIYFVVNCGLFSGTTATTISPNTAMTRGMFVTALGRLAEVNTASYKTNKFTDVKSTDYFAPYVTWVNEMGIVKGTSDTTFSPNSNITREQMAVILYNYSKEIDFDLPNVHKEITFADIASISSWAKVAVKEMQTAGILSGKSDNKFDPQGVATRAEVSVMLKRFVKIAISESMANGFMKNDSGEWMYYQSGTPVKNQTKNIGGESYKFDAHGVTLDYPRKKEYGTYTVKSGDSFWNIANEHHINMYTLAEINGMTIFIMIHPGDVLKIPK